MTIRLKKAFISLFIIFMAEMVFAQQNNLIFRESYRLADIQNIVMALNAENVQIKNFRGYKVTVEAYSNNSKHSPVIKKASKSIILEHQVEHFYKAEYCDIIIYIPYDFELNSVEFISDTGSLTAENVWASKISARSNSGSISFDSVIVKDRFEARTTKGFIKLGEFKGEYFDVRSDSGFIEMKKVRGEYFTAATETGELYIQLAAAPMASTKLESKKGNVILSVPNSADFNVLVLSNSGTFRDNIKNIRKSARGEYEAKYNEGGAIITLQTTSGDITLE